MDRRHAYGLQLVGAAELRLAFAWARSPRSPATPPPPLSADCCRHVHVRGLTRSVTGTYTRAPALSLGENVSMVYAAESRLEEGHTHYANDS